ncbi:MBL fold metallo-hydrolase [Aliamphritea ceti]|uniref:MBL fold metallo-hydrolase n=1 Tax=Aliamphritea ceti TaxID=1524258 RepID=UPI0021C39FEF|nr:MBL fold metallo-hydrolase [Aliamphritea ceti]
MKASSKATFSRRRMLAVLGATVLGIAGLSGCASNTATPSAALTVDVYNPKETAIFPASSSIISGPSEAILIDAQFQKNDAQKLVDMLQAGGKTLKAVYISHGDPDYYFGLDVIRANFPEVKVYASPTTHAYIAASMKPKLAYWGPILKDNAPSELILPEQLPGDTLTVDGQEIKVIGLNGNDPKHTFVWVPSAKTVTGGVIVYENQHVWMADNQTEESRQKWLQTLENIKALQPKTVVPGHYLATPRLNTRSVDFTRDYVLNFEAQAKQAKDAADLRERMIRLYPDFPQDVGLDISTKVRMGEMQWPQ